MPTFASASATDVGNSRATNQDFVYASEKLCIVADGMGGHAGGEVASRSAVEGLIAAFEESVSSRGLLAGAKQVNREIYDHADRNEELRGMGTTLVAMALVPTRSGERISLINVGDSRAYLFEEGELTQLTQDHSLVEEMLRNGDITLAEAAVHPYRHVLTRAIGIEERIEVDAWTIDPITGTRLLLCSDGLTNECTDVEIAEILATNAVPSDACYALVRRALDHGGNDNVSVVVADVVGSVVSGGRSRSRRGKRPSAAPLPVVPVAMTTQPPTTSPVIPVATGPVEAAALDWMPTPSAPTSTATEAVSVIAPANSPQRSPQRSGGGRRQRREAGTTWRPPGAVENAPSMRSLGEQLITFRVALFCFLMALVLAGAVGFTVWFDKATYFIGIDRQNVAIYNGRPGGFLWFHPTLVHRYPLTVAQVLPANVTLLRTGMLESSYGTAETVVSALTHELAAIAAVNAATNSGTVANG